MKMKPISIPASSMSVDDGGESISPSVGDKVNVEIIGVVKSVSGDMVVITPTSINGESAMEEEPMEEEAPSKESMMAMLAQQGGNGM